MDFNERVVPNITANFQFKESLARYEFAERSFKKNLKILDIGCGTGYGSAALGKKREVIGIDNNKDAINYAKKYYSKKVEFLVADALKLPFKKNEFDGACSFEVIEHLKNPNRFLKEG